MLGCCSSGPIPVFEINFKALNNSLSPLFIGFRSLSCLIRPLYCNSKFPLYAKKSGVQTALYILATS